MDCDDALTATGRALGPNQPLAAAPSATDSSRSSTVVHPLVLPSVRCGGRISMVSSGGAKIFDPTSSPLGRSTATALTAAGPLARTRHAAPSPARSSHRPAATAPTAGSTTGSYTVLPAAPAPATATGFSAFATTGSWSTSAGPVASRSSLNSLYPPKIWFLNRDRGGVSIVITGRTNRTSGQLTTMFAEIIST